MRANQSAEGDSQRDQRQASRGRGQGHPRVTAASGPAAQGLFVSVLKGTQEPQRERNREAVFVVFFFLSKYPRLSFHPALRLHRWQGGASSPATNDLLAPWARPERHADTCVCEHGKSTSKENTLGRAVFPVSAKTGKNKCASNSLVSNAANR